jgi:hypothetical protein
MPGQGGSVQANVDRWFVCSTVLDTATIGFKAGTEVGKTIDYDRQKPKAIFASGMPGGPTAAMKDFALRGAILESPSGDVYVKMTGPKAGSSATRRSALEKMVREAAVQ